MFKLRGRKKEKMDVSGGARGNNRKSNAPQLSSQLILWENAPERKKKGRGKEGGFDA